MMMDDDDNGSDDDEVNEKKTYAGECGVDSVGASVT
jgi:hypothetical protein